ncbi:AAA family ATPase [Pseudomonas aeruginosa]
MRITKLEITNFQGLRHAALDVSAPVLLVAGRNGSGKSSLLDAISHAFTGKPGRVAQKQHIGQLITEGAKKGEARVEWLDDAGEVQACGVALPSGKGSPLADSPFLPFVLDASRFAALDAKDRRRVLFDLTGASASPAEVGKRLKAKGIDLALFEKVKPLLRSGFSAMVGQAKDYASEARGAWKAVTGENYGSEKANGWEPEAPPVIVSEEELESACAELQATAQDLDEAQQTLGSSKRAHADAQSRASRITALRETAALADRRRNKLATDEKAQDEWSEKVMAAEAAASGEPALQPLTCPHCQGTVDLQAGQLVAHQPEAAASGEPALQPLTCPHCQGTVDLQAGQLVAHQPPAKVADPEAAKRLEEYRGYLASAQRAVANSQRDLKESEDAAAQAAALEAETAQAPSAEAIANGEQAINELRQARDRQQAKVQSLQEAFNAAAQRQDVIKQAAGFHAEVCAWSALADALSPTGIPAEILADAIGPVNELLQRLSGTAGWSPVQISADIDVTFGGRLYGLLSESERWRCDATIALAIATISGLRLALLDRLDVLDLPSRWQALTLLRAVVMDKEIDSVIVAGTLKEPMAKTPAWLQAVWIDAGQLVDQHHQAAA